MPFDEYKGDLHDRIGSCFTKQTILDLIERYPNLGTDRGLCFALGIRDEYDIAMFKMKQSTGSLTHLISDRVLEVAVLLARFHTVFKTNESLNRWLAEPIAKLDNYDPIELMSTCIGRAALLSQFPVIRKPVTLEDEPWVTRLGYLNAAGSKSVA